MKLVPKGKQVIGRIAITKLSDNLVAPDATKSASKFVLLEAVSDEAAAAGYKPGDMVIPRVMNQIYLRGGLFHRAVFSHEDIVVAAEGVNLNDLVDVYGNPFEKEVAAA